MKSKKPEGSTMAKPRASKLLEEILKEAGEKEFGPLEPAMKPSAEEILASHWAEFHGPNGKRVPLPLEERASIVEALGRVVLNDWIENVFKCAVYHVGSQIEELFLYGVIASAWARGDGIHLVSCEYRQQKQDLSLRSWGPDEYTVETQPEVGGKHPDFVVSFRGYHGRHEGWLQSRVAIECDGHDFHEKTKQQAARDKRRDRELTFLGMPVLRFTGSEIWAGPTACARPVLEHLRHLAFRPAYERDFLREGEAHFLDVVRLRTAPGPGSLLADTGMTPAEWAAKLGFELPEGD